MKLAIVWRHFPRGQELALAGSDGARCQSDKDVAEMPRARSDGVEMSSFRLFEAFCRLSSPLFARDHGTRAWDHTKYIKWGWARAQNGIKLLCTT